MSPVYMWISRTGCSHVHVHVCEQHPGEDVQEASQSTSRDVSNATALPLASPACTSRDLSVASEAEEQLQRRDCMVFMEIGADVLAYLLEKALW